MLFKEVYPSKYVSAEDLDGKDVVLTIKDVIREQLQDGMKPVVQSEETEKLWILNRTNFKTIAELYGENSDDWLGHKVQIYPTEVAFGSEMKLAIRVRKKKFEPVTAATIESDKIPF